MVDLRVRIGKLDLAYPTLMGSGCYGTGEEFEPFVDLGRVGGVVLKSVTRAPRLGNATPRLVQTPAGLLNAIGLQNPGHRLVFAARRREIRKTPVQNHRQRCRLFRRRLRLRCAAARGAQRNSRAGSEHFLSERRARRRNVRVRSATNRARRKSSAFDDRQDAHRQTFAERHRHRRDRARSARRGRRCAGRHQHGARHGRSTWTRGSRGWEM